MPATSAELLLELFSEEIPARMQARAAEDLQKLVLDGLKAQGLAVGAAMSFATPRRLTLVIAGVPAKSPGVSEERKGPRVGAPEQALAGFLKGAGLARIEDAEIVTDAKKGDFYVARIEKAGRLADEIIADVVPQVMAKFPWPKSQRWGAGDFQWVRPLQSIVCLLGGKVVPIEVAGLTSGKLTRGHRFHGNAPFEVTDFEDYGRKLKEHKVLLPASERAQWIGEQARAIAAKEKLELVEDEALTQENAGLTECLTTSMKLHQKCFSLRDPKTRKLTNKFLLVSNLIAPDGGKEIVHGNEKVIRARLADAKFFWDQDLKKPLDEMASSLKSITFHEKLGTQAERVERIMELAHKIAGAVDADAADARRAAQMCKADLVSGMVGEFPELQGLMGRYYAEKVGTKPEIARAIELHYKPRGAGDTVPLEADGDAVACAVALADKIDTLVGFWAIGEKPSGSGDPYQLRRAALGVIRIVLENDFRVVLGDVMSIARELHQKQGRLPYTVIANAHESEDDVLRATYRNVQHSDLIAFFFDRLKVFLRDKGARHDLIDAVLALGGQDDLALTVKRVDALGAFLATDDGVNLLAGVKRASNILSIEEKKDKASYNGTYEVKLLKEKEELALAAALESVKQDALAAINVENFTGAMNALAELRKPVDAFFEKVTVNADDAKLRLNRLRLLSEIRAATQTVADFSKIAG
jgi:glycyl-tRNA synthetase beta chain